MYAWDEIKEFRDKGAVKGEWPTIPELFEMALARFPERPCFTVFEPDRKDLTYKQAYEKIMKGAAFLVSKGIQAGDRVLLNGKNSPEWAIGYFSILAAGGIVVPIDNQMHIDRCMRLSEYAKVRFAICDFDVLEKMKGLGGAWYDSLLGFAMLKGKSEDYPKISGLDIAPLEKKVERSEFDDAAILFTSGTTGNEKGAVLSHRNITSNVYQAANGMHVDETDVLYALLPLHHSYCCTAVLLETIRHGADCLFGHGIIVSRMIADMKMGKVTVFMGIPLLYNKVIAGIFKQVKAKGPFVYGLVRFLMIINGWCKKIFGKAPFKKFFDKMITSKVGLDHSKVLICGAGPLSPTVFKQYQQLGLNFLQGYGLTETAPILTLNPPEHFKIDSVGRVLNFIDMKIAESRDRTSAVDTLMMRRTPRLSSMRKDISGQVISDTSTARIISISKEEQRTSSLQKVERTYSRKRLRICSSFISRSTRYSSEAISRRRMFLASQLKLSSILLMSITRTRA